MEPARLFVVVENTSDSSSLPSATEDLQTAELSKLLPAAAQASSLSPAAENGQRRPGSASQHGAHGRHMPQARATDEQSPGPGHSKKKLMRLRTERSTFIEQTRDMLRQEHWSLTAR